MVPIFQRGRVLRAIHVADDDVQATEPPLRKRLVAQIDDGPAAKAYPVTHVNCHELRALGERKGCRGVIAAGQQAAGSRIDLAGDEKREHALYHTAVIGTLADAVILVVAKRIAEVVCVVLDEVGLRLESGNLGRLG